MIKQLITAALLVLGFGLVPQAQAPAVGSALRGRVVTADGSQTPIAGAVVLARRSEDGQVTATVSDDLGRFEFPLLPSGRYSLTARRAAYLDSQLGTIAWPGIGVELFVRSGAVTDEVTILMPRGGVIGGMVRSEKGTPLPDVRVVSYRLSATGVVGAGVATALTDDRGVYRLFGLPPGTYLVATKPPEDAQAAQAFRQSEVDAALARLARGVFQEPAADKAELATTLATFHPAASNASGAVPIRLGLSDVRMGIDIDHRIVEAAEVTGVAVGPSGPVAGARVTLDAMGGPIKPLSLGTTTGADGTFRIASLSPGEYVLRGTTDSLMDSLRPGLSVPGRRVLVAAEQISVAPAARQRVVLTFSTGRSFKGTLSATGSTTAALSKGLSVVARPTVGNAEGVQAVASVQPDGIFHFDGLFPGAYTLDPVGLPPGLVLVEMKIADRSGLDLSIDLIDVATVDVQLIAAPGSVVRGTVIGPGSVPVSGYAVLLFPQSPALRDARRQLTRLARSGSDGVFQFDSLPPGDYLLSAFADLAALPDEISDFLNAAEKGAVKLKVGVSSRVSIDLAIGTRNYRP